MILLINCFFGTAIITFKLYSLKLYTVLLQILKTPRVHNSLSLSTYIYILVFTVDTTDLPDNSLTLLSC
jgi:hypothetical protein